MKFLYLVLLYFTSVLATEDCPLVCDGVCIKNKYHTIKLIDSAIYKVHDLAYNPNNKTLYVIYSNPRKKNEIIWARYLSALNLETRQVWKDVGVVYWPTALAISHKTGKLYAGGEDGLYEISLDPVLTEFKKIKTVEDAIKNLFLSSYGTLYFVTQCNETYLYAYDEVVDNKILENFQHNNFSVAIDKFVIDKLHAMVYIRNGEVFCLPRGTVGLPATQKVRVDINDANDIAIDPKKDVFIATKRGVFAFNSTSNTVTKYGSNMENIKKIIFVGVDEYFFVVNDRIYALLRDRPTHSADYYDNDYYHDS